MTRPHRATAACITAFLVSTWVLTALAATGRGGPRNPIATLPREALQQRIAADSARAVSTWLAGHPDSGIRIFAPLVVAAPAVRDSTLRARILLLDASFQYRRGRLPEALAAVESIRRMAHAARDTHALIRALLLESGIREARGETAGLEPGMRLAAALAESTRSREQQGAARFRLGLLARYRGDFETARREMTASIAISEELKLVGPLRIALNQMGNIEFTSGRYREARPWYERSLEMATAANDQASRGHALNNLGSIEARVGDLNKALELFERGRAAFHGGANPVNDLYSTRNVAELLLVLGRVDRAREVLEEGLAVADRSGMGQESAAMRTQIGVALALAGRPAQAKAMWRAVASLPDSTARPPQADALLELAAQLEAEDSLAAAVRVTREALRHPGLTEAEDEARATLQLAGLLNRTGRAEEALNLLRPLADTLDRRGDTEYALGAWSQIVDAELRLGRATAAGEHLEIATRRWERYRGQSSNFEFREAGNDDARSLMMNGITQALAEPGAAARTARITRAFDRMQRFKTRTLLERLRGPRGSDVPPPSLSSAWIGLERFRRERLAEGELLLEFVSGADTTWLFAVARDTCALYGLPRSELLGANLALGRDVLGALPAGPAATGAAEDVARRQGALLLARAEGLIARARTVYVAPDAWLHRVPFAALHPAPKAPALATTHEVVVVPSATFLDVLRTSSSPAGRGVLAMSGPGKANESALAGALREVRELAQRYLEVEQWSATGERTATPPGFDGYLALHIAGHSQVDDQYPWRSGFVVGRNAENGDSLLTAAEIAGRRLKARLVVLSSCESAGGRTRLGEGVAGLSTAFLAAGVPAVIATLWPVEDRVTADLMSRLYDQLARGRSAADALRRAQLEVRGRSATRHPYYWAGFVLVGDGAVKLPLKRRPGWRFGGWPLAGGSR